MIDAGRSLAIVSNNSAAAIQTYLSANAIRVAARTDRDAALLKPSPHLVTRVLVWRVRLRSYVGVEPGGWRACGLAGDARRLGGATADDDRAGKGHRGRGRALLERDADRQAVAARGEDAVER